MVMMIVWVVAREKQVKAIKRGSRWQSAQHSTHSLYGGGVGQELGYLDFEVCNPLSDASHPLRRGKLY
jgi:hypothetical protein